MQVLPFSPIGVSVTVAATTANTAQAMTGAPTVIAMPLNLRVVNEGTTNVLIAMGDATANATTDTQVESIPPGERILSWKAGATYAGVAMRAGAANVQLQLGYGV